MIKSDPKPTNSMAMRSCFGRHGGLTVAASVCPRSVANRPSDSNRAIKPEPIFSIAETPQDTRSPRGSRSKMPPKQKRTQSKPRNKRLTCLFYLLLFLIGRRILDAEAIARAKKNGFFAAAAAAHATEPKSACAGVGRHFCGTAAHAPARLRIFCVLRGAMMPRRLRRCQKTREKAGALC